MDNETLQTLLEEWRKIHESNFMIVQDMKSSVDLKESRYSAQKSMRAKEIAEILEPYLNELDLLPREEFEIKQELS